MDVSNFLISNFAILNLEVILYLTAKNGITLHLHWSYLLWPKYKTAKTPHTVYRSIVTENKLVST